MAQPPARRPGAAVLRIALLGPAAVRAQSISAVVVSDGTQTRPMCSWARSCVWDATMQGSCAQKLCESSGYTHGVFNSASGNMCYSSVDSDWHYYWMADRQEYFDGRTLKEAIINATCTKSGPAPTSTQPPVVETTTQMQAGATTTTTAQVEEANVIETMTRTTTTAAPAGTTAGTATSAPATSAGTTAPATAGATTATATAAATTTAATTATTADGATTAAATTAATAATTASAATTAAAATTAGATTAVVTAAGTTVTAAGTTSEVATTRSEVATTTPVTSAVTTTAASPGTSAGEAPATTGALGQADGPTTTPPPGCGGVPSVLNAVDVSPCADLPSGSSCKVRCRPGFAMQAKVSCEGGEFRVPGGCLPEGATPRKTRAVQLVMALSGVDMAWAEANRGSLRAAAAESLDLPPASVLIDFVAVAGGAARRLAGGLEMLVTALVVDDGGEDLGEVAQRYQGRLLNGGGNGGSGRSFGQALETSLRSGGGALPAGFGVAAARPPVAIEEFVVAVTEWLAGAWGHCSTGCGTGRQEQGVACSVGDDEVCTSELGARPSAERGCEDYSGCPFDARCPFGKGNSMDCGAQFGVAVGSLSAVLVCCLAVAAKKLHQVCRPHVGGTITLPEAGITAKYQIYRPDGRKSSAAPSRHTSISSAASLPETTSAPDVESGSDAKTRVVWDTDAKELKQMFADRGTQLTFTAKPSAADPSLPALLRSASSRGDVAAEGRAAKKGGAFDAEEGNDEFEKCLGEVAAFVDDMVDELADLGDINPWTSPEVAEEPRRDGRFFSTSGREMHPAYVADERVEYYSNTMNRWLAGRMQVARAGASSIRYDVVITATRQLRLHVALEDLRRPLHKNEPVELLSRRPGGAWVAATISPQQPPHATNYGYMVDLPNGEKEDQVQAVRLRRRFLVGEHVKAYRGVFPGWVPGRIVDLQDRADDEAPVSPRSASPPASPAASPAARRDRRVLTASTVQGQDVGAEDGQRTPAGGDAVRVGVRPWFFVLVAFGGAAEDGEKEWYPSYLIRQAERLQAL